MCLDALSFYGFSFLLVFRFTFQTLTATRENFAIFQIYFMKEQLVQTESGILLKDAGRRVKLRQGVKPPPTHRKSHPDLRGMDSPASATLSSIHQLLTLGAATPPASLLRGGGGGGGG